MVVVNNADSYSINPSSHWFADMVATSTHISSMPSSLSMGPDDLGYRTEEYVPAPSPVDTSDSALDPLGYPQFLLSQQEFSSTSLNVPLQEAVSATSKNVSDGFCKKSWVEELARLNSRICSHDQSAYMGSSDYMISERSRSCSMSTESGKSPIDSSICLDDALALTKDLIKLLDRLSSQDDPSTQSETSQFDDEAFRNVFQDIAFGASIYHLDVSVSNKRINIPDVINEDPFTVLLFMSCYVRLIAIYKLLFGRIQEVVTREGPQAASSLLLHSQLPTIVVGPFSLRSNPSLEVMLIIELVHFVIGHIGHAARLMTPGTTGDHSQNRGRRRMTPGGTHSMDHIIVSMLSAVEGSEKGLLEAIHAIRDIMTQRFLSPNVTFP